MSVRFLKLLLKNVGELRWNIYYYLFSSFPVCSCWFMSFIEIHFVFCNVLDVLKDAAQLLNHRLVCFHHINVHTTLHMRIHVLKYLVL